MPWRFLNGRGPGRLTLIFRKWVPISTPWFEVGSASNIDLNSTLPEKHPSAIYSYPLGVNP